MKMSFNLDSGKMSEYQELFFKVFSSLKKGDIVFSSRERDFLSLKKKGKMSYWELDIKKLIETC